MRFVEMLGTARKRKLADRLSDFRHRLFDYPLGQIDISRPRAIDTVESVSAIPRVIVQTYRTSTVVRPVQSAVARWQEMNPEFDYHFFDDEASRAFIEQNYPAEVLAAYDALIPGAYRADLWRYCYLAAKGGVYVDIRMEPLLALRTILDIFAAEPPAFVSSRDRPGAGRHGHAYLYNAFIAAAPGHPFVKAALERTVEKVHNRDYGRDLLDISGPGCLGAAANQALGRPIDTAFELVDHLDEKVGRYRILEHDDDDYHRNVLTHLGRPLIRTKCIHGRMIKADRRFPQKAYATLYNRRQVFR
jgi:hypothetical protein